MADTQTRSNLARRLSLYVAAGGAALAPTVHAAPTDIDPGAQLDVTMDDNSTSGYIDIDDDGTNDFYWAVYDDNSNPQQRNVYVSGQTLNAAIAVANNACYGSNLGANVAAGSTVDGSLAWESGNYLWQYDNSNNPPNFVDCTNFTAGQVGYLPIRFNPGNTADIHYGYLQVRMTPGSLRFEILGGEFETADDTGIPVIGFGDPSEIPVVGALPVGLGLLAVGAAALRRRKTRH